MQVGMIKCTKCDNGFSAILDFEHLPKLCPDCKKAKREAAKARKSARTFVLDLQGLQVQILVGGQPIFTMQCDTEEAVHEFVKDQQAKIPGPTTVRTLQIG